jgi:expansin (peptidoglycan-binding protein)
MNRVARLVGVLAPVACVACGSTSAPFDATPDEAGVRAIGASQMGVATFYDATGAGNCSFDPSPNDLMVAAMNAAQYDNSAVCGECVAVTGPMGTVTVRIVDQCPGCESGHLDLSAQAFAMIAMPSQGRVSITWQPVSCVVLGPIQYHFKDGSNPYWVAIQLRNTRLLVQSLEAQVSGAWMPLARQSYNYFVASSGLGPGPFTLRVTAVDGQQLTDANIPLMVNQSVAGAAQFR